MQQMTFLTNQNNDLLVPVYISKFTSVELSEDKEVLIINNIIKLPVSNILEIKVYDEEIDNEKDN